MKEFLIDALGALVLALECYGLVVLLPLIWR